MKKIMKLSSKLYLFVFLMVIAMACPAFAQTISKVSLSLSGSKPVAGNSVGSISCSTNTSGYYVESCDYMNNYGYWDSSGDASCVIGLRTFDENEFSSNVKASVSGMNGRVSNITISDDDLIYVTVSIPITKGSSSSSSSNSSSNRSSVTWLDQVYDVYWSGTTAKWDSVSDAKKYEVQLYRGNSRIASHTTNNRSYNFGNDMTSSGSYYFRVRAVNGNVKGDWSDWSDEYWKNSNSHSNNSNNRSNSNSNGTNYNNYPTYPGQVSYGWIQDAIGWWYKNPDGSYTRNNWQAINGKWYFFDERGCMKTGWINWNNKAYYCGSDGAMYANAYTPDGYYVDASGAWVPSVPQINISAGPGAF